MYFKTGAYKRGALHLRFPEEIHPEFTKDDLNNALIKFFDSMKYSPIHFSVIDG